MNIEDFEPNVGASTPEPSLHAILMAYYTGHSITADKASVYVDKYIAELKKHIAVEHAVETLGKTLFQHGRTYDFKNAYLGDAENEAREIVTKAMSGE